jgi:hypothetical protein
MKLSALALLFFASPAFASTLLCRANYDEGSHYELSANVSEGAVRGPVGLRYATDDGIDLHAELAARSARFGPGGLVHLEAANDSMGLTLDGTVGADMRLAISFGLEHAEPVELTARCALN